MISVVIATHFLVSLCSLPAKGQATTGRRLDDIHIIVQTYDGYWKWYEDYLKERDEQRQRISEVRLELSIIATEIRRLRARWMKLLYLESQLVPTGA